MMIANMLVDSGFRWRCVTIIGGAKLIKEDKCKVISRIVLECGPRLNVVHISDVMCFVKGAYGPYYNRMSSRCL